jgi:predicted SAM-dependent methyltransferase
MFEDNSVDYIYCCGALEYVDRDEVKYILDEWMRVLKPGSRLRISVPDFNSIITVYEQYKDINHRGILGPLYGKLRVRDSFIYHKTVFDYESLKQIMKEVGFKDVKRYDWRDTEHSHIDDYSQAYIPHMDKNNGILMALNLEGIK